MKPKEQQEKTQKAEQVALKKDIPKLRAAVKRLSFELEQKNRDLKNEKALERVRAIAMGMTKPDDLLGICKIQFAELQQLGFAEIRNTLIGIFNDTDKYVIDYDFSDFAGGCITQIPYNKNAVIDNYINQMKIASDAFTEFIVKGKALKEWKDFRKQNGEYDDTRLKNANAVYYYFYSIGNGSVGISTFKKISDEQLTILKKFRNVFDLAYKRYVDITNAQAQVREAKIEVALERTRTQSMLMQHSGELDDTLRVFHEQVLLLGIPSAFSFLWLPDEEKDKHIFWAAWAENNSFKSKAINYPLDRNEPATAQCLVDWKGNDPIVSYHVPPAGVKNYFAAWQELIDGVEQLKPEYFSGGLYYVEAFMKYGCFGVMVATDLTEDEKKILGRFAIEFERTYTRFLDLQKAEAQARESQIQLALERVRARTMAMQKSEELPEAANLLFQQMQALDTPAWSAGYCIWDDNKQGITLWMSSEGVMQPSFHAPLTKDPSFIHMREAHERNKDFHVEEVGGEELVSHYRYMRTLPGIGEVLDSIINAGHPLPTFQIFHCAYFSQGFLLFITYEPVPEAHDIFKRFGKVFDQTYTRFLDLQKAEEQAREAQIEACLERVRSKTVAMHNSRDVGETVASLFDEYIKLGIETFRCGIGTIYKERKLEVWTAKRTADGMVNFFTGHMDMTMHPLLLGAYSAWKKKEEFYEYELKGDDLKEYFSRVNNNPYYPLKYDLSSLPSRLIFSTFYFSEGFLFAFTLEKIPTESTKIFKRFSFVFGQTYRRFLDLQKAEAQAREAQIETGLERVRSRSMGMQKSEELKEVIQVVYEQFVHLNIHVEHTGFIIDYKESDDMHIWLADQHSVPFEITIPYFDSPHWNSFNEAKATGTDFFINTLTFEEKNKFYKDLFQHIPGIPGETKDYYFSCRGLAISTVLLDNVGLYIENFSGIPYSEEENKTLMRFGKVFQQTYTRFLDLQKAEAQAEQARLNLIQIQTEKQRAEDALTELQAAQKQLIQAEKMASLGELTAGIAHEIQNPLNFVNNFSEVSSELISEMVEEVDKGNYEEVKAIADDVKQNLDKINHHGKRAGDIVKGMLQHSRSSSGQKEPTNINALADEYLRLAYHGLRAKDKTFNATMKTDFDETVGNINITPQDIGRVILNLITNAFYVVDEKKKQKPVDYEPTVTVSTSRSPVSFGEGRGEVIIKVQDNGNGIPQKILDKIFQPFFTTKPTGQGTGLGLSLSYDIVKAHGGEIKVETKESEGSTFIIQIPII